MPLGERLSGDLPLTHSPWTSEEWKSKHPEIHDMYNTVSSIFDTQHEACGPQNRHMAFIESMKQIAREPLGPSATAFEAAQRNQEAAKRFTEVGSVSDWCRSRCEPSPLVDGRRH